MVQVIGDLKNPAKLEKIILKATRNYYMPGKIKGETK